MGVKELYLGNLLVESFKRLQEMRISETRSTAQSLVARLDGPEVLDNRLLTDWIALNYLCAVGFDHEGEVIMGEIGGVIPVYLGDGKRVLAFAEASMNKVMHGIEKIQEARSTGDQRIISRLEKEIETPLETRGKVTIVNGNRNASNYDFTSFVACKDPLDMLRTNDYLLLGVEGFTVPTNKHLHSEMYTFNVPLNEEVFRELKRFDPKDIEGKAGFLKRAREGFIPEQFIAGFNIKYRGRAVIVRPLIPKRDSGVSLGEFHLTSSPSPIAHAGMSPPTGDYVNIFTWN